MVRVSDTEPPLAFWDIKNPSFKQYSIKFDASIFVGMNPKCSFQIFMLKVLAICSTHRAHENVVPKKIFFNFSYGKFFCTTYHHFQVEKPYCRVKEIKV